jgi:hypothetical protein
VTDEASYRELKDWTMWELWSEPALHEIFAAARKMPSGDDALAERVLRELYEDAYVTFVRRRPDAEGQSEVLSASEVRDALAEVRTLEAWRSRDEGIWLAPTGKWWRWAEVEKGLKRRADSPEDASEDL